MAVRHPSKVEVSVRFRYPALDLSINPCEHIYVMERVLQAVQIVLAVFLTVAILMQQRGTALGEAFGGDSAVYRARRGIEKFLFLATIALAIAFVAAVIADVLL